MLPTSLRWRLPVTYAALALLTALLLNAILVVTLQLYYQRLERDYLFGSGLDSSAELVPLLSGDTSAAALQARADQLAHYYQVRLQLQDSSGQTSLDTGLPRPLALEPPAALLPPVTPAAEAEATAAASAPPSQTPATGAPVPEGGLVPIQSLTLVSAYGFNSGRRSTQQANIILQDPASGQLLGRLLVSHGPAYGQDIVASVGRVGAAAGLLAALLAAGAGWLVSRRMVAPLLALTEASSRMAGGDLAARAAVDRQDEIGSLAESFNSMAGRVEGTVQTLRSFIADAAHELNTPLTALRTDLELAGSETDPARAATFVARAQAHASRLEELTGDLLDLSRLEDPAPLDHAELDLRALLLALSERYASRAEQAGLDFELDLPAGPVLVRGNASLVRRAVGNVLDNALKFTPPSGRVALSLAQTAETAAITIFDTGIGIPDGDLPGLFSRFHRGRNAAQFPGSGLGLAIVQAIMDQHGGQVAVASSKDGTAVQLVWPI